MVEPGQSEASASDDGVTPSSGGAASPRVALHLFGHHRHALDDKRRVAIPKPFREQVLAAGEPDAWVLCRQIGGDGCLQLFPAQRFAAAIERLEHMRDASLGVGPKNIRAYLRRLSMSAAAVATDKQGRITLTDDQCKLAGITKDVVFVGTGPAVELWAAERLGGDDPTDEQSFGDLAATLFG